MVYKTRRHTAGPRHLMSTIIWATLAAAAAHLLPLFLLLLLSVILACCNISPEYLLYLIGDVVFDIERMLAVEHLLGHLHLLLACPCSAVIVLIDQCSSNAAAVRFVASLVEPTSLPLPSL